MIIYRPWPTWFGKGIQGIVMEMELNDFIETGVYILILFSNDGNIAWLLRHLTSHIHFQDSNSKICKVADLQHAAVLNKCVLSFTSSCKHLNQCTKTF